MKRPDSGVLPRIRTCHRAHEGHFEPRLWLCFRFAHTYTSICRRGYCRPSGHLVLGDFTKSIITNAGVDSLLKFGDLFVIRRCTFDLFISRSEP